MIKTQHSVTVPYFRRDPSAKKRNRGDKDRGRRRHDTTPQPRVFALTTRNEEKGRSGRGVWGGEVRKTAGLVRISKKRSHRLEKKIK